jgi:hypothetical protein
VAAATHIAVAIPGRDHTVVVATANLSAAHSRSRREGHAASGCGSEQYAVRKWIEAIRRGHDPDQEGCRPNG